MGISVKAWRKLAMTVAVPGVAVGALAASGAPAMASTAQVNQPTSGQETFQGYGTGVSGEVPVYASGFFSDHGYIDVFGGGDVHLQHGTIDVSTSETGFYPKTSDASCTETITEYFSYDITGGTGHYSGASGYGYGHLKYSAVANRYHGTCEYNEPIPSTIKVTVDASGPLSL